MPLVKYFLILSVHAIYIKLINDINLLYLFDKLKQEYLVIEYQ